MHIAQHLFALFLVMFGAGCADDMPVAANYVPADCPPAAEAAEKDDPPDPRVIDLDDDPPPDVEDTEDSEQAAAPSPASGDTVDLNVASASELITLPGVGPALAARIIAYREKRPFKRVEDIRRVRGIGPAKYAKLKEAISVARKRQKRQL
jgi:competence protein ComEA